MNHDALLKDLDTLDIEYNGTTNFGDYKIEVEQDIDPLNPRVDWDNLGRMVCWHRRYNLGDDHGYETPNVFFHVLSGLYQDERTDYLTDEQLERCKRVVYHKNIILPLYLYDHSGITRTLPPICFLIQRLRPLHSAN